MRREQSYGYSWDAIQTLGATRRIHVQDGVGFAYDNTLELAVCPDAGDLRYAPSYGNIQSVSNDPRDQAEGVRQATRSTNVECAAQAKALLNDAQTWLDDPKVRAKYGASNLLRYGPNQLGEWRHPYDVLYRDGDTSYQWWGSNGLPYVLIARAGQIVAAYRDPLLSQKP